jgi:hypothetical protein
MDASELIDKAYGGHRGTNIMTPQFEGDYRLPWGACELSSGRGIAGSPIWGVTVVKETFGGGAERARKLSKLFMSRGLARMYIASLKLYMTAEAAEKEA